MLTVFLCHAPADRALARELAEYLERGVEAQIFVDEGEIAPGQSLMDKAREGQMAETIVLLLSPSTVPERWVRSEWEPALAGEPAEMGIRVATALCRECTFPAILRRRDFIDLTGGRLAGFRALKAWLIRTTAPPPAFVAKAAGLAGQEHSVEALATTVADRPGTATLTSPALALEFAARHGGAFEAAFWLGCAGRPRAALAGELGAQFGLPLDGDADSIVQSLQRVCAARRCLLILDEAARDPLGLYNAGGRSSVLQVRGGKKPVPSGLSEAESSLLAILAAAVPDSRVDLERHGEVFHALLARGLVLELDAQPRVRLLCRPARNPAAEAAFAREALEGSDLGAIRHAFDRAMAGRDWPLACGLGRRAASSGRRQDRLGEVFEVLELLYREADTRQDRRVLEECAWEQAWILERWGRYEEAGALHARRRAQFADQLCFDFAAG